MVQDPNAFGNFQYEIYLGGMVDRVPELPFAWRELEEKAREKLTPGAYGYVAGGAGSEDTMRANLEAFRRWRIVPRMLRDIAVRDLSATLFGTTIPAPVLLAPIGVQSIVHPDAEVAVARAASSLGVPIVLSTASSKSMEEVAEAMGDTPRWFQLYWPRDRELTKSFLSRAEAAGYSAVAVTLDTLLIGWRPRDLALAYLPFLKAEGMANYLTDPVFRGQLEKSPEEDPQTAVVHFGTVFSDPTVTWDDLAFLRESTELPILLKGILHPDDAHRAVELGMDGIVVSNHGGRQVDGAIGSLDALPSVVAAVPDDYPVLLDSGVRTGADAFKAVALGARAVFLGRPYMWGLGLAGQEGVRHVVRSFLADLDLTLALSGYTSFQHVDEQALVRSE
jgi:isopentenyl diphosphate isomerase/L-lactate dehydrogenase-like FMN-dependent dehydrogenase